MTRPRAPRGIAPSAEAPADFHGLVRKNLGLVEPIAQAIRLKLPPRLVELDDLIQAGYLGLIDAARRYKRGKGPFANYARTRIRGTIMDSIRYDAYARMRTRGTILPSMDLDSIEPEPLPSAVPETDTTDSGLRKVRLHDALSRAIGKLTGAQQKVLELRYVEGNTVHFIAREFGLKDRRVQQMHAEALKKLRESLKKAA